VGAEAAKGKESLHEPMGGCANGYGVGLSQPLHPGSQVGRLTQGQNFALLAAADLAHHD
jgi:hypothetical protein